MTRTFPAAQRDVVPPPRAARKTTIVRIFARFFPVIMRRFACFSVLACAAAAVSFSATAQQGAPAANADDDRAPPLYPPPAFANLSTVPPPHPAWRNTIRYPHMGSGRALRYGQIIAYAMQIYDYCDNRVVSDEFVRSRLDWFSRFTEREETCDTVLDYLGGPVRKKDDAAPNTGEDTAAPQANAPAAPGTVAAIAPEPAP